MTADAGRNLILTWGGAPVLGVREKSITRNGEPIDTTSDEDDGVRHLLPIASQDNVDVTVSGVTKDKALRNAWHTGARTAELTVTWPDGATLTGQFFLSNYVETGPYMDAITFEATLLSTGETVYDNAT